MAGGVRAVRRRLGPRRSQPTDRAWMQTWGEWRGAEFGGYLSRQKQTVGVGMGKQSRLMPGPPALIVGALEVLATEVGSGQAFLVWGLRNMRASRELDMSRGLCSEAGWLESAWRPQVSVGQ